LSSELGMSFGENHHEKYSEVLEAWANTAAGEKITDAMVEKWGADLYAALSEDLIDSLMAKDDLSEWSGKGISLPSKEILTMFSQIAAKYSLQYATRDLLDRLVKSATYDKENPPEDAITAAIRPMRPSELMKRSPQTLAQIFDMAKDKFNAVLNNHFTKTNQFTGRRRWVTVGKNSRHAALNGEIKGPEELFSYENEKIVAPRPVGGSPAHWSNCSCRLEYETKKGKWVG
jgi:hypothetical protein